MLVDPIALALAAPGHLCLLILPINTCHSIPFRERTMDRMMLAILIGWLGASAALLWATWGLAWIDWHPLVKAHGALCLAIGWVGLPVVTILRALRRHPPGITGRHDEVDLVPAEEKGSLIGSWGTYWFLKVPGNEFARLRRSEWTIEVPGLPPACDGLSLVQVSDLHFTRAFERRYFELVADEVARWDADLMLFTGDLVDDAATIPWVEPVLSRLRGRLGTFAILGNHDYTYDVEALRDQLRQAGFDDVEGRWTRLDIDGASIALGGTAAPWGGWLDPIEAPEADLRIVLSHTPDSFYHLTEPGTIDLILAGHNHGGQVRVPILGPILMPSRYSRRFDRGFFRRNGTLMYVNQGIAGKHPLRLGGCPPEITRFILRPAPVGLRSRAEGTMSVGRRDDEPAASLM